MKPKKKHPDELNGISVDTIELDQEGNLTVTGILTGGSHTHDWTDLTDAPNSPPVAVLQAKPSVLYLGEAEEGTTAAGSAVLSLTLSYDVEGGPLTYAFDPLGGVPSAPASYGSTSIATAVYSAAGDHVASGWVRDGDGAFEDEAAVTTYESGRRIRLTEELAPLTLRESAGLFAIPIEKPWLKFDTRLGFGAWETFVKDGFVVEDNGDTADSPIAKCPELTGGLGHH